DTVAKINTTARVLTFGVVPPDNTIGAGDIFTKDRFISKSVSLTQWSIESVVQGFFRLKFDFMGLPTCTRAFVGWYTMMPIRSDYNSTVFGRHGWLASTEGSYCQDGRMKQSTCDQSFTPLIANSTWIEYTIEPALESLIDYPRNDTAIAEGIYLTIESLGPQGDACFFDNIVLEELIPSTNTTIVSAGDVDVTFKLNSPSFVLQPSDGGDEAASGNFVRVLEINGTTLLPQVLRYVPGVDYTLNRSTDGRGLGDQVVTFSNSLPLYGIKEASCAFSFATFSQDGVVDTGLSNFTAPTGSLEWSLTLRHWPFINPSNTLLLEFGLSHFASASGQGQYVIDEVEFVAAEKTHRYTLRAVADDTNSSLASGLVIKLIMPLVATVDGVARSIDAPVLTTAVALAAMMANTSALSGSPVSALQAARGDRVDTIAFVFPSFSQSLTYDPNLGLLVAFIGRQDSGSSSSDDHTLLIVLTTVLVSCALLLVIVAGVATLVVMKVKASRTVTQEEFVQLDHRSGLVDENAL
ncbi:uncharacterized protein ACA1_309360, partial [Acanthamoeba castellanii str. Neff]